MAERKIRHDPDDGNTMRITFEAADSHSEKQTANACQTIFAHFVWTLFALLELIMILDTSVLPPKP